MLWNLDELRLKLFRTASSNNRREIPPSGSQPNIKYNADQSGLVWDNPASQEPSPQLQKINITHQNFGP